MGVGQSFRAEKPTTPEGHIAQKDIASLFQEK